MRLKDHVYCPNCRQQVPKDKPGHETGCLIGALLRVLEDRGHDLSDCDITAIDVDAMFERYLGPAADAIAYELLIPPFPA